MCNKSIQSLVACREITFIWGCCWIQLIQIGSDRWLGSRLQGLAWLPVSGAAGVDLVYRFLIFFKSEGYLNMPPAMKCQMCKEANKNKGGLLRLWVWNRQAITYSHIPLVKGNHMDKPKVKEQRYILCPEMKLWKEKDAGKMNNWGQ